MELQSAFQVPDFALPVVERIVPAQDRALIAALDAPAFFSAEARALLSAAGESWSQERTDELLRGAYRRGVLELEDESFTRFRLGSFYSRLEVFAVTQPGEYLALPEPTRRALDAWCFDSYLESLGADMRPTSDRVTTLEETLDVIDGTERAIWLNRCDCRTLAGDCDAPTDTCITFKSGINTLSHRGWSEPLTKDEAKSVVRRAHRRGLVQTVNDNGICNCCSDCCYLFRAQRARGAQNVWPPADSIAVIDDATCIGCLACIRICPFNALHFADGHVVRDARECRGCGVCADVCRPLAISMQPRGATLPTPHEEARS